MNFLNSLKKLKKVMEKRSHHYPAYTKQIPAIKTNITSEERAGTNFSKQTYLKRELDYPLYYKVK